MIEKYITKYITKHVTNNHLKVRIKPSSPKTKFVGVDEARDAIKIAVAAPPENGKANKELLKFLKKQGINAKIISGTTSRNKLLKIIII